MVDMVENPEIEQVKKFEDENIEISKKNLNDTYTLIHDVTELYNLMSKLLSASESKVDHEFYVNSALLLSCQYQFTISCLAILRGHLTDSLQSTRRAIESCAFAYRILKHPHLAEVWINAGDNDKSNERFKEKFSGKNLFPDDHDVLQFLGGQYDFCSKQMHSRLESFATRLETEDKKKSTVFKLLYCDIPKDDPLHFFRVFFTTINIHMQMLKVFEEVFKEDIKQDKVRWELHYNNVHAKYWVHLNPWKDKMWASAKME